MDLKKLFSILPIWVRIPVILLIVFKFYTMATDSSVNSEEYGTGGGETPILVEEIPSSNRKVTVSGTIDITDDETFSDERKTIPVSATGVIGIEPSSFVEMEGCAGDEVRVTLELNAQGAARNDVLIKGTARLYEGTSCTTTDLEHEKSIQLTVPADSYAPLTIDLISSGFGGGDTAKINLNFGNFPDK